MAGGVEGAGFAAGVVVHGLGGKPRGIEAERREGIDDRRGDFARGARGFVAIEPGGGDDVFGEADVFELGLIEGRARGGSAAVRC